MSDTPSAPLLSPEIFAQLKRKLEVDAEVNAGLALIIQQLDVASSYVAGLLARIHSTPIEKYQDLIRQVEEGIKKEIELIGKLDSFASAHPFYKYNHRWTNCVQNTIFNVVLCGYIGGMSTPTKTGQFGRLLSLEEVGEILQVPTNLKDRDSFHITVEEYLLALTSLTQELSRLVTNFVTLGNLTVAVQTSVFIKELHAGFQNLTLRNDTLRKRFDGMKYAVKHVEGIIYDLKIRNLVP